MPEKAWPLFFLEENTEKLVAHAEGFSTLIFQTEPQTFGAKVLLRLKFAY